MPIPFIGRLNIIEYLALVGSFLFVGLESVIRVLTLALPPSLINLCYRASRRFFNWLTTPAQKRAEQRRNSISKSVRDASDFVELCRIFGYEAEEHVLQTKDGFLLGVHRLAWRAGEEGRKVNSGPNSITKKVVYLHHGLLMNSEVWVCLTDAQRCLPFVLVEKGYDVWLGNNRGNKYSKKSTKHAPTTLDFWNFSIDEFAFHDIPDTISYILNTTAQQSLSYIGFSQGTAQAFATLAIHPKLNEQVNVFIALAPAMSPAGLSNGIVDALVKASPQVLFLLFGRRSILSSATMWQSLLYPPIFAKFIDYGLSFLFNWQTKNISLSQKLAAYPHLYSFTSTKSVVHWFQIIRNKSFQMYDDDVQQHLSLSTSGRYTKVARYPTRNIKTPIVLVYGGSDSLVDIKVMLKELPPRTIANEVPHYEHLDFLWARDVDTLVFPHVFAALNSFTGVDHTPEEYAKYHIARQESMLGSGTAYRNHESRGSDASASEASAATESYAIVQNGAHSSRPVTPSAPVHNTAQARATGIPSPQGTTRRTAPTTQHAAAAAAATTTTTDEPASSPDVSTPHSRAHQQHALDGTQDTRESPTTKLKGIGVRRDSNGSILSLDTSRGINIGASRAAGGVVTKDGGINAKGIATTGLTGDEGRTLKKKRK